MSVIDGSQVRSEWLARMDDGLVLNRWNGRPIAVLKRDHGGESLHWLVLGTHASVDVWLHLALGPGGSEELLSYPAPRDLWSFVGDHKAAAVTLMLDADAVTRGQDFENPGGPDAVNTLLMRFRDSLAAEADADPESEGAKALRRAVDEIDDFLD